MGEEHHGGQQDSALRVLCLLCLLFVCPVNCTSSSGHPQDALSLDRAPTAVSCPFPLRCKHCCSLPRAQSRTLNLILPGVTRTAGPGWKKHTAPLPAPRLAHCLFPWPPLQPPHALSQQCHSSDWSAIVVMIWNLFLIFISWLYMDLHYLWYLILYSCR